MAIRQHPRSTRLLVVVLVSVSLAVITLDYRQGRTGPLAGLGDAAKTAMAPLQEAVTTVTRPIGDFFSGLAHLPSLADENQRLKEQNAALLAKLQTEAFFQRQYEELKGLLDLKRTLDPSAEAAVVIANGVSNFEWTVTIDKGSDAGLELYMPVVTGSAEAPMLVGRVVSVSSSSNDVQLIIDRDSAVAGVLGESEEAGLVEGRGEEDLEMSNVATGTEIEGNEAVFTQSYEVNGQPGIFPPGLLIGQVSRTVPEDNAIQESVSIRPAVDFETLEFVLVLKVRAEA